MKKIILSILSILSLFTLVACGSNDSNNTAPTATTGSETTATEKADLETISVVCTLEPHSVILQAAEPYLNEKGYTLDLIVVDDYYTPNKSVNDGDADANYFQHIPFFEGEVASNGYDLVNAGGIHIEPFGFYSKTIKSTDELKDGATIVISNSVADHGRILNILQQAGLITLRDGVDVVNATTDDIIENPKNLQFVQTQPELLTTAFNNDEGDLVAINGNFAIGAGLNPTKDAVILEKGDSTNPYVNIIACRTADQNSAKIKALVEVLQSDEIKNFILEHYADGSVIPAEQ